MLHFFGATSIQEVDLRHWTRISKPIHVQMAVDNLASNHGFDFSANKKIDYSVY